MKFPKQITFICSIALLALGSAASHAGDCKNVKQKFYNEGGTQIKVKKSEIQGNDGTWTEDFSNITIDSGKNGATNGRRMNKLDSGETPGYIKVYFDRLNAGNNTWKSYYKTITDVGECYDDKTYHLYINQNG